jgi:hypothetical protein
MAFGKLRKIWEKIKGAGKKVFGFVKNKVIPLGKVIAPVVGGIFDGPAGALAGGKIANTAENVMGNVEDVWRAPRRSGGLGWRT